MKRLFRTADRRLIGAAVVSGLLLVPLGVFGSSALAHGGPSAAQYQYKVTICHHTGSASHPYTIIKTSEQGCVSGHAGHSGDYITSTDPSSPTYDPTCQGGGCLPVNAPCDATDP